MTIVITSSGQYVDDQTGRPVDPRMMQQMAGSALTVPEMQSDRGALARDVETILRNRSGAAVPPAEIESYLNMIKGGEMSLDDLQSQFVDPIMREGTGAALTPQEMMPAIDNTPRLKNIMQPDNIRGDGYTQNMRDRDGNMVANYDSMTGIRNLQSILPKGLMDEINSLVSRGMTEDEAMEIMKPEILKVLNPTVGSEDVDDVAKVGMLVDMGLSPVDAMEAVAREKISQVNPSAFGGRPQVENPGMGALSGVPTDGAMMPTPMPRPMQNPNSLEQMRMEGRDRSFNPMDSIRPDNTPNT